MDIKIKFGIGEKVFTLDSETMKIKEFEVGSIGIFASRDKELSVTYYDNDHYSGLGFKEQRCFATEKELLNHITTKEPAEKETKG